MKCCNCHILLAVDMAGVASQGMVCVCVCEVGKMAKDIGMTIRKGIVVLFLPLFGCFLEIPSLLCSFIFLNVFFLLLYHNSTSEVHINWRAMQSNKLVQRSNNQC